MGDLVTRDGHLLVTVGGHLSNKCPAAGDAYIFYGDDAGGRLKRTDAYVIATDSWVSRADAPNVARQYLGNFAIDGFLYACGGDASAFLTNAVAEYNRAANTWDAATPIPETARMGVFAWRLDGDGYAVGGNVNFSLDAQTSANRYNKVGDSWDGRTAMPSPARGGGASFAIADKGYAVGGRSNGPTTHDDVDEYDDAGDSWAGKTAYPGGNTALMPGAALNSLGYVFGTGYIDASTTAVYEYNPGGDSWAGKTARPNPTRHSSGAFVVANKAYVSAGRQGSAGAYLQDFEEYDPDNWTTRENTPIVIQGHSALSPE